VADSEVPIALSESYVSRARAGSDRAELRAVQGADHFQLMDPASRCWPIIRDAVLELLAEE